MDDVTLEAGTGKLNTGVLKSARKNQLKLFSLPSNNNNNDSNNILIFIYTVLFPFTSPTAQLQKYKHDKIKTFFSNS